MAKLDLYLMYFCALVAMSVLYAPQPIAVLFESELGIARQSAGLFIAALMIPLGLAGFFYGYILERASIRSMLFGGFLLLGVAQVGFGLASKYEYMLALRAAQGLVLPVAMIGIMSYISVSTPSKYVAAAMGAYIGVTIIGGLVGRAASGILADFFGWRFFIILVGVLCLFCAILVRLKCSNISASLIKPRLKDIKDTLKERKNLYTYGMIFCLFFTFQALLNYVPFELAQILGAHSGSKTGALYAGYALGVLISFNVRRIGAFFGGARRAVVAGVGITLVSIVCFGVQSFWGLFGAMVVLCIGNFIAHSNAAGFVNRQAKEHKGIANGLYVSFYYMGGALGSFLPGFIYNYLGWIAFLCSLGVVCAFSLAFAIMLAKTRVYGARNEN